MLHAKAKYYYYKRKSNHTLLAPILMFDLLRAFVLIIVLTLLKLRVLYQTPNGTQTKTNKAEIMLSAFCMPKTLTKRK